MGGGRGGMADLLATVRVPAVAECDVKMAESHREKAFACYQQWSKLPVTERAAALREPARKARVLGEGFERKPISLVEAEQTPRELELHPALGDFQPVADGCGVPRERAEALSQHLGDVIVRELAHQGCQKCQLGLIPTVMPWADLQWRWPVRVFRRPTVEKREQFGKPGGLAGSARTSGRPCRAHVLDGHAKHVREV